MARRILIVGAGGIGSWLAYNLYKFDEHKQLSNAEITFADDDTVDLKNLPYQHFEAEDVTDYKTESLSARFGFESIVKRLDKPTDLTKYDLVVSAVDNTAFRKLLFETAEANPDMHWIDLRSEGRSIAAFTKSKNNTLEKMMATIPEEVKEGSCQREYELANGIIQSGNRIVAEIGAQYILNWLRGDNSAAEFSHTF